MFFVRKFTVILCTFLFYISARSDDTHKEQSPVADENNSNKHTSLQDQVLGLLEAETIHPLKDSADFDFLVLNSELAAVVVIRTESIHLWREKAYELRGIVRIFLCTDKLAENLLNSLGIEDTDILVYPAGDKEGQIGEPTKVTSADEAVSVALSSIDDEVIRLRRETVSELLVDAIEAVPSTFPVLIITKKDEIRPGLRAMIPRLGRYFRFGVLAKAPKAVLDEMEINTGQLTYPTLLVLTVNRGMEENEANPLFGAVQYESKQVNSWTYPHLLEFFLNINHKYRRDFVGDTQSNSTDVLEMTDVMEHEIHRLRLNHVVRTKKDEL